MNITISKFLLEDAVKKVSKAINSRTVVPVLTGIQLVVDEEGLTLTASDSDFTIRKFIPNDAIDGVEVIKEGSIVLPAKKLSSIASTMPDNLISIKSIDLDEFKVRISSGKSKFTLNGFSGEEYPQLPEVDGEGFGIDGATLKSHIEKTVYAVSKSETRPILTGVNMFFENNRIGMVATDSHRLSKVVGGTIEGDTTFEKTTLPEKSLKELSSLIGNSEEVTIKQVNSQIIFETEDLHIRSRLLEGKYPETDRLIPLDHKTLLTVERAGFLSAMQRSAILADNDTNVVTFEIANKQSGMFETIELSQNNGEVGQSKEEIIVDQIEGEELTITFNPKYMIDTLKRIDDEKVIIEFNGNMRPFIIKPSDGADNFIQLILPVRNY